MVNTCAGWFFDAGEICDLRQQPYLPCVALSRKTTLNKQRAAKPNKMAMLQRKCNNKPKFT